MSETKVHYDTDADVLYVAFGRSDHVTGIELADNILLRLDTGSATHTLPRAVGLTFLSFARLLAHDHNKPLSVPLSNLRDLPADLWQAVLTVLTTPPVNDFWRWDYPYHPSSPRCPNQHRYRACSACRATRGGGPASWMAHASHPGTVQCRAE